VIQSAVNRMKESTLAAPDDIQKTGIRKGLLEDIALKILYLRGEMSLVELGEHMGLSLGVIEEIFQFFRKEQLCEVKGMTAGSHRIVASGLGKSRAADLLSISQYVGAAPVSLAEYATWVKIQSVQTPEIGHADLRRAFQQLVLSDEILSQLGTAVFSGTSIFLVRAARRRSLFRLASSALRFGESCRKEAWIRGIRRRPRKAGCPLLGHVRVYRSPRRGGMNDECARR
jgi:hypothetical protein